MDNNQVKLTFTIAGEEKARTRIMTREDADNLLFSLTKDVMCPPFLLAGGGMVNVRHIVAVDMHGADGARIKL